MRKLLEQLRRVMEQDDQPYEVGPKGATGEAPPPKGPGKGRGKGPGGPEWRKGRAKRRASCPYAKESSCEGK